MSDNITYYPPHLKKIKIIGDSHSLFRAFAKSVDGSEDEYQKYRDLAAAVIERDDDLQSIVDGNIEDYLYGIRNGSSEGGELEIKALAKKLERQVIVFRTDFEERKCYGHGLSNTILLFSPIISDHPNKRGHFDLLADKMTLKIYPTSTKSVLECLTKKLKKQVTRLPKCKGKISGLLQTSFLKTEDLMDITKLNSIPEVSSATRIISKISQQGHWFQSDDTVYAMFEVFQYLQSSRVLGQPTMNFFRLICYYPDRFVLHSIITIVYTILSGILMILSMLARMEGWFTVILGFTSTTMAAVQVNWFSSNAIVLGKTRATIDILSNATMATFELIPAENEAFNKATLCFAIITGILAASKGLNLNKDHLFETRSELTIEILSTVFGVKYTKPAVIQNCFDCHWFSTFAATLRVKKIDLRKVQDVRTFISFAESLSLVSNEDKFKELVDMKDALVHVESALLNPHNYFTLQRLTEGKINPSHLCCVMGCKNSEIEYMAAAVHKVDVYYNKITSVPLFSELMKSLNDKAGDNITENRNPSGRNDKDNTSKKESNDSSTSTDPDKDEENQILSSPQLRPIKI